MAYQNEISLAYLQKLHSENGGTSFLNSTGYSYNERGWMTGASSPRFTFALDYDRDGAGNVIAGAQYNGNIVRQRWGHGSTANSTFSYSYDTLSRLTNGSSTGTVMSKVLAYDDMGNITNLKRDGHATGISYTYTGNRLMSLSGALTGTYTYDANGNATKDRTGMTFSYNHLNLPKTATKSGTSVTYLYDALGTKLRKTATVGSTTTQRDYVGGIEYSKVGTGASSIEMIHTEEGYLQRNAGNNTYTYHYNLTDHLGNVRATLQRTGPTTGNVIQKHDYYPFGKAKAIVTSGINKYLYNGKELQGELGGQYDYGARFYDAEIGRWNVIDPMLENHYEFSPYNYVLNNPLTYIDPFGLDTLSANTDYMKTYKEGVDVVAIDEVTVTRSLDVQAQRVEGVGQPGTAESMIPVWGSGRAAIDHFQHGNYGWGAFHTAMAVSDVFLVKSIAIGLGKGAWKAGSHSWSATRKWMGKRGYAEAGQPVHHWAVPQATAKKYGVEGLTNQPWNLMTFPNQSLHMRAGHGMNYLGQPGYGALGQFWYGTPTWFKAGMFSGGGRIID